MKTAGKIIIGLFILLLLGTMTFIYLNRTTGAIAEEKKEIEITGSIEGKEVDVNVKVPGKISRMMVDEGDEVTEGQVLAVLEADNIKAKADLTQAVLEAANAQYSKATNGARPQQLQQAQDLMEQAKAGLDLAQTTFERLSYLYKEGVLARQKLDMAKTELEVARKRYSSAKEQYDMVREGAQKEDIKAAGALVKQAEAACNEVQTYINDATIKAPISGIITMKSVENGELVSTGLPVVTISDLKDVWVEVKVRETLLSQFSIGSTVPVKLIGLPQKIYQGKVTYIGAKPSFATERSYQERGEKDLVSFAVKIKLSNDDLKLRPGMTAVISLKRNH